MFRFFAFVWNDADEGERETARHLIRRLIDASPHWRVAFKGVGLEVLCAGQRAGPPNCQTLANRYGVVAGTIFERLREGQDKHVPRRASMGLAESSRIISTSGRDLVDSFWRSYVAFLQDGEKLATWVVRGPATDLPCLQVLHRGVRLFFSFMEDCARLNVGPFSINWAYVARSLLGPFRTERTGLNEVSELLPGACLELGNGRETRRLLWNPYEISQSDPLLSPAQAADALRTAVWSCTQAWASCYGRIVHYLSGGLDSSIVLACLADAPKRRSVMCVNHYYDGADSDERYFARLASERAGVPLIERKRIPGVDLRSLLQIPRFESPFGFRMRETSRAEAELARQLGTQAAFYGRGGDELFCRHHTRYAVADFVCQRGLRPALLSLALDSAVTDGLSVWAVLHQAMLYGLASRQWKAAKELYGDYQRNLLLAEATKTELLTSSLFDQDAGQSERTRVPPGKLWQILLVTTRHEFYDPFSQGDEPEEITPLLSQPVIETCLRIPTYLQRIDRRDRAIARRAFAGVVPEEIIDRRSKGGVEQYVAEIYTRNLDFARSLLIDGFLVREGILDRRKVENALVDAPTVGMQSIGPIMALLGREAWIRSWLEHRYRETA